MKKDVPGITEKMLIQELRYLELLKIIDRHVYFENQTKVEYSLTNRGRTLIPVIENIVSWGYCDMKEEDSQMEAGIS